jgi:hypothetical protein
MTRHSKPRLAVQPLEAREVPATLVNPTTLTYRDTDGDDVQVVFSKPILTAANVNQIFTFDTGTVDGNNAVGQQLRVLQLDGLPTARGSTITIAATKSAANGGDDLAAVGQLQVLDLDLKAVTIDGDVGSLVAGDARRSTPGIGTLTVQSMGRYGTTTGAGFLAVGATGGIGSLVVHGDVRDTMVTLGDDKIGKVSIGGSLIGGADQDTGTIRAGRIGDVEIKGSVVGGLGTRSGSIVAGTDKVTGAIGNVVIGGDLLYGPGPASSGQVSSTGGIKSVTIGGSVSGGVNARGALKAVTVAGNLNGGLIKATGPLGTVSIAGDMTGGVVAGGTIRAEGALKGVTVGGNMGGRISVAGKAGPVAVTGSSTGFITLGAGTGVTIGGDLKGTGPSNSGRIHSPGRIDVIQVGGDVVGSDGDRNGSIHVAGAKSITIGDDVIGGLAIGKDQGSGYVYAGDVKTLKVGGDVVGGESGLGGSGYVQVGRATAVEVVGDVIGGTGWTHSGAVLGEAFGSLTIGGSVIGGSATGGDKLVNAGYVQGGRIANLTIGKSLVAGTDNTTGEFGGNGAVVVTNDLAKATIGSLVGNATNPAIVAARGQAKPTGSTDVAIGSLTVTGNVDRAQILAGYGRQFADFLGMNGDAQIGSVTVGGDWIGSSLVAGVYAGPNKHFGDGDAGEGAITIIKNKANVSSKIGSVDIAGAAVGTADPTDFFGITAQTVAAVRVGFGVGGPLALKAGKGNDDLFVGPVDDFKVREV